MPICDFVALARQIYGIYKTSEVEMGFGCGEEIAFFIFVIDQKGLLEAMNAKGWRLMGVAIGILQRLSNHEHSVAFNTLPVVVLQHIEDMTRD